MRGSESGSGNLLMYGKANPVDALQVFGEYVQAFHGKDGKYPTDGHFLGEEVPIGQGKVNYPVFIERLKEVGYDGDITIERENLRRRTEKRYFGRKRISGTTDRITEKREQPVERFSFNCSWQFS